MAVEQNPFESAFYSSQGLNLPLSYLDIMVSIQVIREFALLRAVNFVTRPTSLLISGLILNIRNSTK